MNVQRGLERVSTVWWGFWGLMAVVLLAVALFKNDVSDRWELAAASVGGVIAVYVAHRITCWIVAGFFAPRS